MTEETRECGVFTQGEDGVHLTCGRPQGHRMSRSSEERLCYDAVHQRYLDDKTRAWQEVDGIMWRADSDQGFSYWTAGGEYVLAEGVIDGIDGWYLSGPGVDRQWMGITFVESARVAARIAGGRR